MDPCGDWNGPRPPGLEDLPIARTPNGPVVDDLDVWSASRRGALGLRARPRAVGSRLPPRLPRRIRPPDPGHRDAGGRVARGISHSPRNQDPSAGLGGADRAGPRGPTRRRAGWTRWEHPRAEALRGERDALDSRL